MSDKITRTLNQVINMDRFLLSRPNSSSNSRQSSPTQSPSRRPSAAAKQGKVSALVRVAEFGRDKFYADGGKLFCRACNVVVEHVRKCTVQRHGSHDRDSYADAESGVTAMTSQRN